MQKILLCGNAETGEIGVGAKVLIPQSRYRLHRSGYRTVEVVESLVNA